MCTHTHTHTHSFYTSFINRHALEARCSYKNWGHRRTGNDADPNLCSPKVHILEGEVDREGRLASPKGQLRLVRNSKDRT